MLRVDEGRRPQRSPNRPAGDRDVPLLTIQHEHRQPRRRQRLLHDRLGSDAERLIPTTALAAGSDFGPRTPPTVPPIPLLPPRARDRRLRRDHGRRAHGPQQHRQRPRQLLLLPAERPVPAAEPDPHPGQPAAAAVLPSADAAPAGHSEPVFERDARDEGRGVAAELGDERVGEVDGGRESIGDDGDEHRSAVELCVMADAWHAEVEEVGGYC